MKRCIAVIPARMAASRFPGKPLVKILGLPMIEHVRRRVGLCAALDDIYVATCDREIADVVEQFGGRAVMTADTHERCTDRVEEAVQKLEADIVVIVQGDEPLFTPGVIDMMLKPMSEDPSISCSNLLSPIHNKEDIGDKNIIKTLLRHDGSVMYFSRAAIPFARSGDHLPVYRQTGLSAFTKRFLHQFSDLPATPLEIAESIDFLRILEHGHRISGVVYDQKTIGVDQPADVEKIERVLKEDKKHKDLYEKIL